MADDAGSANLQLIEACQTGSVSEMETALKNGAFCDYRDDQGWTPLHYACEYGQIACLEVLLKAKCQLFVITKHSESPWSCAMNPKRPVHDGHRQCLQKLAKNGIHLGRFRVMYHFSGPVKEIRNSRDDFLTRLRAAIFSVAPLVLLWHCFLDTDLVIDLEGPALQLHALRAFFEKQDLDIPFFGKIKLLVDSQVKRGPDHEIGFSNVYSNTRRMPQTKQAATPEKKVSLQEFEQKAEPAKKPKKKKTTRKVKKKSEEVNVGGASIDEEEVQAKSTNSNFKPLAQIEVMSYTKLKRYCKKVGLEAPSHALKKALLRLIIEKGKYVQTANDPSSPRTRKRGTSKRKTLVDRTVLDIMKDIPLFAGWNPNRIQNFLSQFETVEFRKGEDLIVQGEIGDEFMIIVEGHCEVLVNGEKVLEVKEGDYVGELALMGDDNHRSATVRGITPTTVLACDRDVFQQNFAKSNFAQKQQKVRKAVAVKTKKKDKVMSPIAETPSMVDPDTVDFLANAIADIDLFREFPHSDLQRLVGFMKKKHVMTKQVIIEQGDEDTDTFYVVGNGSFDILIDGHKIAEKKKGECVGEIALMFDQPRNATVQASEDSVIWEMKRAEFRDIQEAFMTKTNEEERQFLSTVPQFASLSPHEINNLVAAFDRVEWPSGSIVIRQGDIPDEHSKCYVLREGTIEWRVTDAENTSSPPTTGQKTAPYIFGDLALLNNKPRAATIITVEHCVIMEISRAEFDELLGPLGDLHAREKYVPREDTGKSLEFTVDTPFSDLKEIGVLGKGAFGLVTLVKDVNQNKAYALKAIKKSQVVENGMEEYIVNEKNIMLKMGNPFLVNLCATYQDSKRLYLLLEVCLGGELFNILRTKTYFSEPTARFYTACVVEGFAYMHSKNIIYRDLKPENLVLDGNGYLKITDFGFAKEITANTFTFCGTPDYLAPEVIKGTGHSFGVDWWTMGILLFEMLGSMAPFVAHDVNDVYKKILKSHIKFPGFFSKASRKLILGLLRKKQTRRLGVIAGGAQKIRDHEFFTEAPGWDWTALQEQTMEPPIIPLVKDEFDLGNFAADDEEDSSSYSAESINASEEVAFSKF